MAYSTFPITQQPTPPYTMEKEDNVLRSPTDGGYIQTRRKYTRSRYATMDFNWQYLSENDYLILMDFYENIIEDGSLPFYFNFKGGTIEKTYIVLFKNPPKASYVGMGLWEVTCNFMEV